MIVKQLSVFLENKPGVLARVCQALAEKDVNIVGFSVSDSVDHAVFRIVVDDPAVATHVLGEGGALVVGTRVLAVKLPNRPGAVQQVAEMLAEADINIEYAYGAGDGAQGLVFLRVSDVEKAQVLLKGV